MHEAGFYKDIDRKKIAAEVQREGFDPYLISDPPGATYPPHSHRETKLLVILSGNMEVNIQGEGFSCSPGDRLLIPGNMEHSAKVGENGCQFFWSEKLL
ncbi:MAG TPA: AraC family ligand binding domain-containing protein [Nitrospiria bacterium]|jgi:quercetin dioxygenase-like cupin family protein